MDLRNWEFYTSGSAVAGADVFVYEASLAHPNPNSPLASTTTNSDGMWAFSGLSDSAKDVKVEYLGKAKWYKGLTRHSVGVVFHDDHQTTDFLQLVGQPSVAAPGASTGRGRIYQKTNGRLFCVYENGSEGEIPSSQFAGQILTSMLASNAVTQVLWKTSGQAFSVTGTAWGVDSGAGGLNQAITVGAGSWVVCVVLVGTAHNTAGQHGRIGISRDGAAPTQALIHFWETANVPNILMNMRVEQPGAGTFTYALAYQGLVAGHTLSWFADGARMMLLMEVKR